MRALLPLLPLLALAAAACSPATMLPAVLTPPVALAALAPSPPPDAPAAPAASSDPAATAATADPAATPDPASPAPPILPALAYTPAPRDRVRAVVLVYHLFGPIDSEQAVETAAFEQQLDWLAEHDVPVVGTSDLLAFLDGTRGLPERAAVIQIDDGHVSVRDRAVPILRRHQVRFTLALNTEAIEGHRPEAVTWDDVRGFLGSGLCEIASHSHIHGHMERLTDARNQSEATLSRSILEARTGVRPEAFVYPFGGNDVRVRHTIEEAGYRAAFGVSGGAARAASARFGVPRVGVTRGTTLAAFARLFGEKAADVRVATRTGSHG